MPRKQSNYLDDYNKPFAKRVRLLIEESGKNQEAVAHYLGKTRQAVGSYCSGLSKPDWETIVLIAKYFGVSTDYLLGMSDVKSPQADIQAVCQYTNLTEAAVDGLQEASVYYFINTMFANGFAEEIPNIDDFAFAAAYERVVTERETERIKALGESEMTLRQIAAPIDEWYIEMAVKKMKSVYSAARNMYMAYKNFFKNEHRADEEAGNASEKLANVDYEEYLKVIARITEEAKNAQKKQ